MNCDCAAYAQARWTPASFIARVIALRAQAQRPGEEGAAAASRSATPTTTSVRSETRASSSKGTHISVGPNQAEAWYSKPTSG